MVHPPPSAPHPSSKSFHPNSLLQYHHLPPPPPPPPSTSFSSPCSTSPICSVYRRTRPNIAGFFGIGPCGFLGFGFGASSLSSFLTISNKGHTSWLFSRALKNRFYFVKLREIGLLGPILTCKPPFSSPGCCWVRSNPGHSHWKTLQPVVQFWCRATAPSTQSWILDSPNYDSNASWTDSFSEFRSIFFPFDSWGR